MRIVLMKFSSTGASVRPPRRGRHRLTRIAELRLYVGRLGRSTR